MYIINCLDTTATRATLRALLLTAVCFLGMIAAYYVTALVVPVLVAALTAVAALVVTVASAALSAAAFAVTMLTAVAVRMVVVLALVRVMPMLWRAVVALWAHRDGLMVAAKGLAWCAVVVGCFVGAILVAPLVLAVAGKVIVTSAVMAGAIVTGKVM